MIAKKFNYSGLLLCLKEFCDVLEFVGVRMGLVTLTQHPPSQDARMFYAVFTESAHVPCQAKDWLRPGRVREGSG